MRSLVQYVEAYEILTQRGIHGMEEGPGRGMEIGLKRLTGVLLMESPERTGRGGHERNPVMCLFSLSTRQRLTIAFASAVLALGPTYLATIGLAHVSTDPPPDKVALFSAIRAGGAASVEALLKRGVNANARSSEGMTSLMYAAIVSDLQTMRLLLDYGADVNAHDDAGTTALMWSVGDTGKLSLLLQHGAEVNARSSSGQTALLTAANLAEPEEAIQLLLAKGADAKYSNRGYTALMGAAEQGDLRAVRELLTGGADVKAANNAAWTALHGAAMSARSEVVRILLDAGANPNAKVSTHGMTPLHWAAASGDPATVRLLIERGAQVEEKDTFNQASPLIWATASDRGSAALIRLLLSKGADPNSRDKNGETALTWALRSDEPGIVALLRPAGETPVRPPVRAGTSKWQPSKLPIDAIQKSLVLVEGSADTFLAHVNKGCVSCHHQALPLAAVRAAQDDGLSVGGDWTKRQSDTVQEVLRARRERLLQGMGLPDRLDAGYDLFALDAASVPANDVTDALVHYLTLKQTHDGRWRTTMFRPPINDSDFTITALAIKGFRTYTIPGRARELSARVRKAHDWLASSKPRTTEDRAFQVLGLVWSGARSKTLAGAVQALVQSQREDGGWSQLSARPSDAYATGEVLVALLQSGRAHRYRRNIGRGIDFLLSTQRDDGSWLVESRSMPVQNYFESGFPYERSQFISCAATSWATRAILAYDHQFGPAGWERKGNTGR